MVCGFVSIGPTMYADEYDFPLTQRYPNILLLLCQRNASFTSFSPLSLVCSVSFFALPAIRKLFRNEVVLQTLLHLYLSAQFISNRFAFSYVLLCSSSSVALVCFCLVDAKLPTKWRNNQLNSILNFRLNGATIQFPSSKSLSIRHLFCMINIHMNYRLHI